MKNLDQKSIIITSGHTQTPTSACFHYCMGRINRTRQHRTWSCRSVKGQQHRRDSWVQDPSWEQEKSWGKGTAARVGDGAASERGARPCSETPREHTGACGWITNMVCSEQSRVRPTNQQMAMATVISQPAPVELKAWDEWRDAKATSRLQVQPPVAWKTGPSSQQPLDTVIWGWKVAITNPKAMLYQRLSPLHLPKCVILQKNTDLAIITCLERLKSVESWKIFNRPGET